MQIEWFECFLETSRCKSLSKASEKLNITQPALSKLVRNLERELGVTLFTRTVTGVELTPAGVQFQERIEPIVSELRVLFNELKLFNDGYNQLKIAALPSIATYYLPGKISSVNKAFPETQLVVESTSDEVLQRLINGDVQAAIAERKPHTKHFWQSILFEDPYYCIFPDTSPFFKRSSISISDIHHQPLVVYPSNCDVRNSIVRTYAKWGATPKVSLEIPFSESILAFVGAGAGIAIVPKIIADEAHRYGLKAVGIHDFQETRKIYVLAQSGAIGKLLHKILL